MVLLLTVDHPPTTTTTTTMSTVPSYAVPEAVAWAVIEDLRLPAKVMASLSCDWDMSCCSQPRDPAHVLFDTALSSPVPSRCMSLDNTEQAMKWVFAEQLGELVKELAKNTC